MPNHHTKREATFFVDKIPVYGDVILAPMTGYSDIPYRAICREYGSSMQYTEFVPVEALGGKRNKFWKRLDKQPNESPMVFQIFGNDPQMILDAAIRIESLEPDIIDINMGCSTRRVSGRGAGVGMMKTPEVIAETFRLLSSHLSIPVTGKIRLGWEENKNYVEIGRVLEDSGAKLVAIHGRTKEQKYNGTADWDAIAELKQALSVPVVGNGDVFEVEDIDRMKAYTGCDAVMVGRGAIGNPWIFSRMQRADLTYRELLRTIRIHVAEMVNYHGNPAGLIQFRKHFKKYIQNVTVLEASLPSFMQAMTPEAFEACLAQSESDLDLDSKVGINLSEREEFEDCETTLD
ncbi:MAG: tRNA-dihydrouridine synthase B [Cellvibrionaceae bacterium]|jgi:tRNA-dihydrouridine synthase B